MPQLCLTPTAPMLLPPHPFLCIDCSQNRSIEVDLQAMLCANALASSRSTLGEVTMYHTRATTIFLSSTCDGHGSVFGHTSGRLLAARSLRDESLQVSTIARSILRKATTDMFLRGLKFSIHTRTAHIITMTRENPKHLRKLVSSESCVPPTWFLYFLRHLKPVKYVMTTQNVDHVAN